MLRLENGARFVAAVAFVAALALAVPPGMADDAPLNLQGGSAKPMAPGQSAVRMRSEVVILALASEGYSVDARFDFFNDGPSTTVAVGFPEMYGASYNYHGAPLANFQTWVDGAPAAAREVPGSGTGGAEPYGWRVKDVAFPAGKATRVRVRYDAAYQGDRSNTGASNYATYLFGTGRGWSGPIGRALFVVKLASDFPNALVGPSFHDTDIGFESFRLGDRLFAYELKDIKPAADAELAVEFLYGPALNSLGLDDCSQQDEGEACPPASKDYGRWRYATEELPEQNLLPLTLDDLRVARNAFFAGHGRTFRDAALGKVFSRYDWYKPVSDADVSTLGAVEKENSGRIAAYEERLRAAFSAGKALRDSCSVAPARRGARRKGDHGGAAGCEPAGEVSLDSVLAGEADLASIAAVGREAAMVGAVVSGQRDEERCVAALKALLASGSRVDDRGLGGDTAMIVAARLELPKVALFLLEHEPDHKAQLAALNARNERGETPLLAATRRWSHHRVKPGAGSEVPEIVSLLIANGADLNAADGRGDTPLDEAARGENAAALKFFLDPAPREAARKILPLALRREQQDMVALLIAKGAMNGLSREEANSVLLAAAYAGRADFIEEALRQGADLEARDSAARTPLVWAAQRNMPQATALLLARGAHVDNRGPRGETALMAAASAGHERTVEILLKAGADAALKDSSGKTAAELARGRARSEFGLEGR